MAAGGANGRHKAARNRRAGEAGFTLVELLVVIAILGLLAALTAPQVLGYLGQSKSQAAQVQIKSLATALELFYLHNGGYPTEQAGLPALVARPEGLPSWRGPYLKGADGLRDPWGRTYRYRMPGRFGDYDVFTLGRDDREGGGGEDRDVTSW
jgi:general secretion pathway protein G